MSLTSTYNVLVTIKEPLKIREYTATGVLLRVIFIPVAVDALEASCLLSVNRNLIFVITKSLSGGYRVCKIDIGAKFSFVTRILTGGVENMCVTYVTSDWVN